MLAEAVDMMLRRGRAALRLLLAVAVAGLLSCQGPPRSAQQAGDVDPTQETAETVCTDAAELAARVGASCRITGRYQIKRFPGKKEGTLLAEWPVIVLSDGTEVMLDSLWDRSKAPDREIVVRLEGKQVVATGTVHREPPVEPPQAANILFWCLSPVAELRLQDAPRAP